MAKDNSKRKPLSFGSGAENDDLEPDIPASGHSGSIPLENLAEIEDQSDPVAEAYSCPDGDFRVELFRVKPTSWRGQDLTGYCDDLVVDDSFASIKSRFGGGMYRVVRRDIKSGKLQWARVFKIAGQPVIPPPVTTDVDSQTPALVPAKNNLDKPVVTMDLGGVSIPITGDIAELQRLILFVKAIKSAFPDPPDYNQALLAALIERKADDPLDLLTKLRAAVPEVFGGSSDGGGEPNLYSLLQEAVKQAGSVLGGMSRRPAVQSRPMPARRAVPAPSIPETANPEPEAAPESEVEQVINPQQIALAAVSEIVKAFIMEPPQEAADVVNGLDLATGIQAADRPKLATFKGALRSMAERSLPEYLEDFGDETLAKFRTYFDQVFDLFVDPGRVSL